MKRRNLASLLLPAVLLVQGLGGCAKGVDNGAAGNNVTAAPSVENIEEPDAVNRPKQGIGGHSHR